MTYKATASVDGSWRFDYPEGDDATIGEVWVEQGKPVQFYLATAPEVDEPVDFYVPAMRVGRAAIPERFQTVWFTPEAVGDFHVLSRRLDGQRRPQAKAAILHVVDAETFATQPWVR